MSLEVSKCVSVKRECVIQVGGARVGTGFYECMLTFECVRESVVKLSD